MTLKYHQGHQQSYHCNEGLRTKPPTSEASQQEIDSMYYLLQARVSEQMDSAFTFPMSNFIAKVGAGKFGTLTLLVHLECRSHVQAINKNNLLGIRPELQ